MSRKIVMEVRINVNDDAIIYSPMGKSAADGLLSDRINEAYDEYEDANKKKKHEELNPSCFYCYNMNQLFFGETKWPARLDVFHVALYTDGYVYFRCKQCRVGSRLGRLSFKIRKAIFQYLQVIKQND